MRIGIDLGGTKTESVAIDDAGTERVRLRVSTPSHGYDEIIASIVGLVRDTEAQVGQTGTVGIGIPAPCLLQLGWSRMPTPLCSSAIRLIAILRVPWADPCAWLTTPTASPCRKPRMERGPGARVVFGVIVAQARVAAWWWMGNC